VGGPTRLSTSIRRRFVFTVGTNLLRGLTGFATGMLLARWLGPESYGTMSFLLGTMVALCQLLDLGSSSAFFTFLSQKSRSRRFVFLYFAWLAFQLVGFLLIVGVLLPAHWLASVWQQQPRSLVLLAFAAAFFQNSAWPAIQQAGESQRRTQRVQGIGAVVALGHLGVVVLLARIGTLGLYALFAAVVVEHTVACVLAHRGFTYTSKDDAEPVLPLYARYCTPLILYSIVGFAYAFWDRWLLQRFGGSVEQAYYGIGAQVASLALITTLAMLRIFWKESSEAHHSGDIERMRRLYHRVSRIMFFIAAAVAGFLVPWSKALVLLLLGPEYASGAVTLAVMFLYPIHQSLGQIVGTLFLATEKVALQVKIGIAFMFAGVVVTYFVLAPADAALPGLALSSKGLAVKMVVLQLLQVNILAFVAARLWGWKFEWLFQPLTLLVCGACGWLAQRAAASIGGSLPIPAAMALGLAFYGTAMAFLVLSFPALIGLTRSELLAELQRTRRAVKPV